MKSIESPTVAQFIEFLKQFPKSLKLTMEDPDTTWTINVFHAEEMDGEVNLFAYYTEMDQKERSK